MHRLEMNELDQRIAKVCDPATAKRYDIGYDNPHTGETRLSMLNILPSDVGRAREALIGQGCTNIQSWFHGWGQRAWIDRMNGEPM